MCQAREFTEVLNHGDLVLWDCVNTAHLIYNYLVVVEFKRRKRKVFSLFINSMGLLKTIRKVKRQEREMRILMLGLDNAGKTTVLMSFCGYASQVSYYQTF